MNRIGKKIAWMSLSGMMIFSLSACGKKDNAADETLIDPDYIIQEYETTTTDEGYTIINGFYRIKSNNGDKDTILYIPYIENKQQGVSYLEELHIKSSTERRIDLEAGNTPDGALYNKQTSSDYGVSARQHMNRHALYLILHYLTIIRMIQFPTGICRIVQGMRLHIE